MEFTGRCCQRLLVPHTFFKLFLWGHMFSESVAKCWELVFASLKSGRATSAQMSTASCTYKVSLYRGFIWKRLNVRLCLSYTLAVCVRGIKCELFKTFPCCSIHFYLIRRFLKNIYNDTVISSDRKADRHVCTFVCCAVCQLVQAGVSVKMHTTKELYWNRYLLLMQWP